MIRDMAALQLLTRVAALGSFSAAGRECGLSQSQVSRIVADLEEGLGTRLLSRTTRAVVPTDAGVEFLARLEPIFAALDEAEQSIREGGELRGSLRVSMPTSIGIREIIPRMEGFTARHPALRIHFLLEDKRQDLVRDAVDVAIRVGQQKDSTGTTKKIATIKRMIVAAPSYMASASPILVPQDLARHRIVFGPAAVVPSAWSFDKHGETVVVELAAHVTSNENEGAVASAAAGLGITSIGEWSCRRECDLGSLVPLLTDWRLADVPVYAHFPMGKATRAAGRAFVDYLATTTKVHPSD